MLWPSVRNELCALIWLLPLLRTNLAARWSADVFATDASEEGFGVVNCTGSLQQIRAEFNAGVGEAPDEESEATTGHTAAKKKMADVFAGEGGFGVAVAQQLGVETEFFDNAFDAKHDLTATSFREELRKKIVRGLFFLVHFAPPCSTWSRARLPPLRRPGEHIEGVLGLTAKQRERLREGTALARACVLLAEACLQHGVGFSIENPRSSMMWLWGPMAKILEHPSVIIVDLVYCRFGAPWLKPTRLVTNIRELAALQGGCPGGHVHQALRGTAPCGTLWTRLACAYPAKLCEANGGLIRKAC